MSRNEKQQFYRATAHYHEASCRIFGVDAVVHLENDNDRWFWSRVLALCNPGRRYRFIGASLTPQGNLTSGCGMCLKYRRYTSRRFFVCVDSDLRYLLDRESVSVSQGILQTYTYSWENHALLAPKLQRDYRRLRHVPPFDFSSFLRRYSEIVYEPMLLMLWSERGRRRVYPARQFNDDITMVEQRDDEKRDGRRFLERLAAQLARARLLAATTAGFRAESEGRRHTHKGLNRHTAYLYVRGHCIYNALRFVGRRLCGERFDRLLMADFDLNGYRPAEQLRADVRYLDNLPLTAMRRR